MSLRSIRRASLGLALVREGRISEAEYLDRVSKILALSLCRRYGLRPLRHAGQRRTTIMVEAPATFVAKVFWPLLDRGGQAVTDGVDSWLAGVIQACIYDDVPDDSGVR